MNTQETYILEGRLKGCFVGPCDSAGRLIMGFPVDKKGNLPALHKNDLFDLHSMAEQTEAERLGYA